jgi:hypothetical protein
VNCVNERRLPAECSDFGKNTLKFEQKFWKPGSLATQ